LFDVIVCGAGPAGSVAATVLARGGARVLLLERARFPRDKLCGDTINPGAVAHLRRLGLEAALDGAAAVDGMIVTGERGVRVQCAYGASARGYSMLRRDLDGALVRLAVREGVRLEEEISVRRPLVDESGGVPRVRGVVIAGRDGRELRVPAPIVIGADGRRSRLALPLGLSRHPARPRRWAVGAYFENVADLTSFGEMHIRRGRYIGIARVPSTLANVCLVVPRRADLDDPASLLQRELRRDPWLRDRFASAGRVSAPIVLGPLAIDAGVAGVPGLLLAGDAAGFIDPMTGDGLRFAIRGGELAAECALAALAGRHGAPHARLERLRRREFSRKWRFNRSLRAVVGHGFSVEAAGVAAITAPWMFRTLIRIAGDVPNGGPSQRSTL
jgi:geranylgeranyl reductase family protein